MKYILNNIKSLIIKNFRPYNLPDDCTLNLYSSTP